jgi:hypothetical protein
MNMPKIRFIRPYGEFRTGDIIAPSASLRLVLIRQGFAKLVVAPKANKGK